MRVMLALVPIAMLASPAAAQTPADPIRIPPELTDPAMADKLGRMMGAVTKSLMDLPIGEMEAAIQGRPATPADKAKRVRDTINDPNLEQRIAAEAADGGRTMQASMKAMAAAMPAISRALNEAAQEIERATANLPQPGYPQR
jgi:hypothetical protein